MDTLPIEPFGLRLVLGGGVRLVSRGEGIPGSTTILVRGAPGTGKTVLGVHIATSIAKLLGCDVAYGCVEILPPELGAIVLGLETGSRVESSPFSPTQDRAPSPRILAGMLGVGDRGAELSSLPQAIDELVSAASAAASAPRVVVIDSLSDGYGLGAHVPRVLADEVCKAAAEGGRVFVLLEESIDATPSPWCFAADIVLELSLKESAEHGGTLVRWLSVIKNRFGAAEPGPHQLVIRKKQGVEIRPTARSYLRDWSPDSLLVDRRQETDGTERWGNFSEKDRLPPFEKCSTLVVSLTGNVHAIAAGLGEWQREDLGAQVWLRIGGRSRDPFVSLGLPSFEEVPLWEPLSGVEDLLARAVGHLVTLHRAGRPIRRAVVGNLKDFSGDPNEQTLRRFLTIFLDLMRHLSIPTVLFYSPGGTHFDPRLPPLVDVTIEVGAQAHSEINVQRTNVAVTVQTNALVGLGTRFLAEQLLGTK